MNSTDKRSNALSLSLAIHASFVRQAANGNGDWEYGSDASPQLTSLVDQIHELLTSSTATTTNTPFIEWFYVYAWNAGARAIALDGMERHALLTAASRSLLHKSSYA